jgi:mannose-6-phosphate isomerase-like protein (cupin superfamily)
MIVRRKDQRRESMEKPRGGTGTVNFIHFVEKKDMKGARLMAELTLPVGAGFGYHEHVGEAEYFFIVSGTGVVNDNGKEEAVGPGDMALVKNGESHCITNTGTVPLVLHAIIVLE